MQTVSDFIDQFQKIDLDFEIQSAMIDDAGILVKQQQDQMYSGKGSDGEMINPLHGRYIGYAFRTQQHKKSTGQISGWVTLKEKGDFYRGIFIDVRSDVFILDSGDWKTQTLIDYYGEKIFGFNDDSLEDINEPLTQTLIGNVEKRLS